MGSNKKTQDRVQCETGQEWIAASGINAGFPGGYLPVSCKAVLSVPATTMTIDYGWFEDLGISLTVKSVSEKEGASTYKYSDVRIQK